MLQRIGEIRLCALVVGMLCGVASANAANLVTNPGFEDPLDYIEDWPNVPARWGGDIVEAVSGPHNGIVAFDGQRMLRFEAGNASNTSGHGTTGMSQAVQVIELGAAAALVATGNAVANASAYFNRIAGDAETDTQFRLALFAYGGNVNQHFDLKEADAHLLLGSMSIFSDADPATWELAALSMVLPAATTFLVVEVAASEDVVNDLIAPEFDGHYADAVVVTIVPEPTSLALVFIGFGGIVAMCRRNLH